MRLTWVALLGFLILPSLPCAAQSASTVASVSAAKPPAGPAFDFEDNGLSASEQEEVKAEYANQLKRWPMVQPIVRAVVEQEAVPMPIERVQAIDAAWRRGEDPESLATRLARNDCARQLQTLLEGNPGYAEASVADDRGVLVCMSHRASGYWLGSEASWSRSFAGGTGAVFVSRREREESTGLDLVRISMPVRSAGRVVGVLVVGRLVAPR